LVDAHWSCKKLAHHLLATFVLFAESFEINSEISSETFLSPSSFSARITKRDPVGRDAMCGATAWRILRAKRWRFTDPPTVLLIINPHFAESLFVTGEM
jgi:hypothetical protein